MTLVMILYLCLKILVLLFGEGDDHHAVIIEGCPAEHGRAPHLRPGTSLGETSAAGFELLGLNNI